MSKTQSIADYQGDGVTTTFTLPTGSFTNFKHLLVYVDGLYVKQVGNLATTVSISPAPVLNADIKVLGAVDYNEGANLVTDATGAVTGIYNTKDGSTISLGGGLSIIPPKATNIATRYWQTGSPNFHNALAAFFTGASTTNIYGHTNHFVELEGKYTDIRLIFANYSAVNQFTISGMCVASATDLSVDKKKDALFAAGNTTLAPVVVPVRTGAHPAIAFSNWLSIAAVERTDSATAPAGSKRSDGSLPYVLAVRTAQLLNDGTNMLDFTYMNRTGADWLTGRGQIWAAQSPAVASLNLTGAFGGGNAAGDQTSSTGYPVLAGVQYKVGDTIMTEFITGSSLSAANNDALRGLGYRCGLALSTKLKPIEIANFGMSSNASTNAQLGATYTIPLFTPTHVTHEFYNPNDIASGSMSQATFDNAVKTLTANRQKVFQAARAVGARPMQWDGIPRNATNTTSYYDAATDLIRLAGLANEATIPGYITVPLNAAMQDGAVPQRLKRVENGFALTETVDNLHLNGNGEVVKATTFTPYWQAEQTAYFSQ